MTPNRAARTVVLAVLLAVPSAVLARPPATGIQSTTASDDAEAARLRLATVNGEAITLAGLREAFAARHSGHGTLLAGREILERVLEKAIEERLLIQEGRRIGLQEEPAFREAVRAHRDLLRLEVLEERFIRAPSEPPPADIREVYVLLPRQMRLAILETGDRPAAEAALAAIRKGEPFEDVARGVSTHGSRTRGGDLGWITWGQMDPETEAMAFRTETGAVAGPFAAGSGVRLLKVVEVRQGTPPSLENIEPRIRAILRERRQQVLRAELLAAIRRAHPAVEDKSALTRLLYGPRQAQNPPDPPDDAVLMKTATGLTLTAGRVRERALRPNLPPAEAWRVAAEDTLLIDEARRRIRPDAAIERRVRRFVDARVRDELESTVILKNLRIDDAEVRDYYDQNRAVFGSQASYHLRHIVLPTLEAAEETRRAILKGTDLAVLAKQKSVDAASAARGGDLGWVEAPAEGSRSQVSQAVFELKAGETSPVLQMDHGFAVVQVLAVRPGIVPPYEKARHQAAQRLMIIKQQALRDVFVAKLREQGALRTFPAALERAVALQEKAAGRRLGVTAPDKAAG